MTRAFPSIPQAAIERLRESHDVNVELSFRSWLTQLTGKRGAELDSLIKAGNEIGRNNPDPVVGMGMRVTPMQRKVLSYAACGFHNDEIAAIVGVGSETVKTHVRAAVLRLGASSRTEAVVVALFTGQLDLKVLDRHFDGWGIAAREAA